MGYVRLSGENAFGWQRDSALTVGGLRAECDYLLLTTSGRQPFHSDVNGAWRGNAEEAIVIMEKETGRVALYNEEVLSFDAAKLLAQEHMPRKKAAPVSMEEPLIPAAEETEEQLVVYRERSGEIAVDALPELIWPDKAQELKEIFAEHVPLKLFDAPGWRFVRVREGNMVCCFGYMAEGDRVTQALYGVQARGGIVPKGLRGYQYERALDGGAYWTIRQRI